MRGVFTALVTPFDSAGKIDFAAYKRILQAQVAAGVAGVIPCGTTGESPTLSLDEKKALILATLAEIKGAVKVIAGTGSNSTEETAAFSRWASEQKVDGVLIVTPYYNKPSQAGLEAHFLAVAEAVSCEVILYNVPGRTGVSLSPATAAKLARHPRIRSLKEATGNVALTSEILDTGAALDILSGDDATYLPLLCIGAVGVISVASNLFPKAMVALQRAMDAGEYRTAQTVHRKYYPLFRDLFVESNPVPIKFAMERVGLCGGHVRAPLAALAPESAEKLSAALARCGVGAGSAL